MQGGYRLSPLAQQDIKDIRAYYLDEAGASVARHVLRALGNGFRLVGDAPGIGHSRLDLTDEPVRVWPVFSFLIVYDPAARPVGIARVLHGRRNLATLFARRPPRV